MAVFRNQTSIILAIKKWIICLILSILLPLETLELSNCSSSSICFDFNGNDGGNKRFMNNIWDGLEYSQWTILYSIGMALNWILWVFNGKANENLIVIGHLDIWTIPSWALGLFLSMKWKVFVQMTF